MDKGILPEIALGVVINSKKNVLIVRRAKEEKGTGDIKLSWAFPGGEVKKDETKEDAVEREVLEETGYKTRAKSVVSERKHPQFPVYVYYIECELDGKKQTSTVQDNEIREIKWVSPPEIRAHFTTDFDSKVSRQLGV